MTFILEKRELRTVKHGQSASFTSLQMCGDYPRRWPGSVSLSWICGNEGPAAVGLPTWLVTSPTPCPTRSQVNPQPTPSVVNPTLHAGLQDAVLVACPESHSRGVTARAGAAPFQHVLLSLHSQTSPSDSTPRFYPADAIGSWVILGRNRRNVTPDPTWHPLADLSPGVCHLTAGGK